MILRIPAIDLIEGKCVRLYQGDYSRRMDYADDPVEQALRFQSAGFRRVHLIDLEGAREGAGVNRQAIRRVVESCRVPVQVGGGIRSDEDVAELLDSGVSYLILGTVAVEEPHLVDQWVGRWGSDRFIVSLDLRQGRIQTRGWLEESDQSVVDLLERVVSWNVKELISTDVEKDGTLEHPNYPGYRRLLERLQGRIPLTAAGGISAPEHIARLAEIGLNGVVIGRALYEGLYSWEELLNAG